MKIKAVKEFVLNSTRLKEGETVEADESVAKDLVAKGYAGISTPPPPAKSVPSDKIPE